MRTGTVGVPTAFSQQRWHDIGHDDDEDNEGKAIHEPVIAQLDQHLDSLSREITYGQLTADQIRHMSRTAYIVLRDTGRRPGEICSLYRNCVKDGTDGPDLIWDNHKSKRHRRRLPVEEETANAIRAWLPIRARLDVPAQSAGYRFLIDGRYGWAVACEDAFGTHPVAICHEWNTIAHLNDYEGRPEARPFTREEIQRFLDYADDQVERAVRAKRKGALAAYRDVTLFKVIYGWGLRRTETSKLDLVDFGRNAKAPQFGRYGTLNVRYGKAKKGRPSERAVSDGPGGGCGRRLRGERTATVRLRGPPRVVGDRARVAGSNRRRSTPGSSPTATP